MRHDDRRLKIKLILQTVHGRRQRQLNAIKSIQHRSATINAVIKCTLCWSFLFIVAHYDGALRSRRIPLIRAASRL